MYLGCNCQAIWKCTGSTCLPRELIGLRKNHSNKSIWQNEFPINCLQFHIQSCILVAAAEIMGGSEVHVEKGSTLNLTCVVRNAREKPHYLLWYHKNEVYNTVYKKAIIGKPGLGASINLLPSLRHNLVSSNQTRAILGHVNWGVVCPESSNKITKNLKIDDP